jgi:hypothetical protein
MNWKTLLWSVAWLVVGQAYLSAQPSLRISEIMYHPVERPAFNADGSPVLDLSEEVHEFVELHNAGATALSLDGWRLSGGIAFDFPLGKVVPPGGFVVVAKNPARLAAVTQYRLTTNAVLGPWSGQLGNGADTIRLRAPNGDTVDAVSYSARFPWAISADALGAEDEWTGLNSMNFQYRGRSLERVSYTHPANDPANWLASPLATGPTPGRTNSVQRAVPRPIVTSFSVVQASDGSSLIRPSQPTRLDVVFSATNQLSSLSVEYFLDDINRTNESRFTVALSPLGAGADACFTGTLPGQANRSLVRFRIRANRGAGLENVSPRADDPFAWHAYFVTPPRDSTNWIYDCFISTASLFTLQTNIVEGLPWEQRRVVPPDPPGLPRTSWNATEPAVFVYNGDVYDIRARYHGSQYRRAAANNSWKFQFPRYKRFEDREGVFVTDNTDETVVCHALFRAVGQPSSYTRWVDLYLNNSPMIERLELDEMDDRLSERFAAEQALANPGMPPEGVGEFYKAQGIFLFHDPLGPYGYGGLRILPTRSPYWTELQRYEWTFGLQMHAWKGHLPLLELLHGLWAARGDSPTAVNPNVPALRTFLSANFEVDEVLTCMAVRTWAGSWDDFNHNHFLWRRANGRWGALAWDFDGELGGLQQSGYIQTTASIYLGEFAVPLIYTGFYDVVDWVDANWLKDSFYKAFREEYRRKLFILNNTLLHPTNITALGFGTYRTYADARSVSINSQLGLGAFRRPLTPTNLAPAFGQAALPPALLQSSTYRHSATLAPGHASTTWIIRPADGTYAAPIFKTTSTSNLTSLPIPFAALQFGETYFWKCVYTDTNGHPSPESTETPFVYGAEPTLVPLITLDSATLWRYDQSGVDPPPNWMARDFDDSSWAEGAPLLADDAGALPEPIRTPLQRGIKISFYFRKAFNFSGDPATASLRLRHVVDDGVVLYLNGVEVLRTGMPAGGITPTVLANRSVNNAAYEGPFLIPSAHLIMGTNVLAAEVHRFSPGSPDVVFGLTLDAAVPPAPGGIVLNEVLADNRAAAPNGFRFPDYLELFNTTDRTQSLNGMSLSDNVQRPGKYVFPADASIAPYGFLLVWCDDNTNAPGLHTGFALDNDGQTVALFTATTNGYTLSDSITFGLQVTDWSIGREADGAGTWQLNLPTPGDYNVVLPPESPTNLNINEWMATDANGPDWFELYSPADLPVALGGLHLTDDLSDHVKHEVAALSFIGPRGFRQFIADEDPAAGAHHVDFRLSGNGEAIGLYDQYGAAIDTISFGPQASGVSQGRLPDGTANIASFPTTASPGDANYLPLSNVVINEVLSHSDPPLEDAVEFYNPTGANADISGWWLSDEKNILRKFRIPTLTVVPAHGFLVLYESLFNADPNAPGSFSFNSAHGDEVYLAAAEAGGELTGYRTSVSFDAAESGVSIGRFATSQGLEFGALSERTFGVDQPASVQEFRLGTGLPNASARVGPVVISEIQYHPTDREGDDNDRDEFIELQNIASADVPLFDPVHPANTWRLRDAVDFVFPQGVTLAPGETVLVLGFDPLNDFDALLGFLENYGTELLAVRLFGPWNGKLDNSSDSVELVKPDTPVDEPGPDSGFVPSVLVDKVKYADRFPWPAAADGTGQSLQRSMLTAYGNDPTNWFASGISPGLINRTNAAPVVSLIQPAPSTAFNATNTIVLQADASDSDGSVRQVEFFVDGLKVGQASGPPFVTSWTSPALGPHALTARAVDNSFGAATSVPVAVLITNGPPSVNLTAPLPGSSFSLPTEILLQANASDSDGAVVKVEFFAGGEKLGQDTNSPYSFLWTNVTAGTHTLTARATDSYGVAATSSPVTITADRSRYIAYVVPAGTIGARAVLNGLGMDFDVRSPIVVSALGVFDSASDGISGDSTMTAQLYRRTGNAGTLLASLPFAATNAGTLVGGSRFKPLNPPLLLSNGTYTVACYGFSPGNPDGDVQAQARTWTTDDGGGLIAFTGSRFGSPTPGVFPSTDFAGPVDSFAAGTFEFLRMPLRPTILSGPTNIAARAGNSATFSVVAAGQPPLFYRWYYNDGLLAGQTNTALQLTNVQPPLEGGYAVVVSNTLGAVTSAVATLTVLVRPTITVQPVSVTGVEGGSATFSIAASGSLPINFRWRKGGVTFTNAIIRATPSNSTLTLPQLTQSDATNYNVAVTNAAGAAPASSTAVLTVLADGDRDGIPDELEPLDGAADSDGDGLSNAAEYFAGTDHLDPNSFLKIEITSSGGATISFQAVAGHTYSVEYSDGLNPASWTKLAGVLAASSSRIETMTDPAPGTNRFYRLVTPVGP